MSSLILVRRDVDDGIAKLARPPGRCLDRDLTHDHAGCADDIRVTHRTRLPRTPFEV